MSKTIADYTAAVSIDAANDYLLIEPSGNTVYKKISRNILLGLSSAPLGTTDSQSPTNKTFDNTNIYTIRDDRLTIQDNLDTTKQMIFQLSGITTATTRTITIPDASLTMVGAATTQTLTNKTITSPTITGGTIDNSTITVDSIAGHTSSTIVTVANLQISNGVLNSANAVTATSIAVGAIQPQALVTGTGSGWAWQSWTPTWANLTVGNGVNASTYIQTGKTVICRLSFTFGTTSTMGSAPTFTLPVTSVSAFSGVGLELGVVRILDAGTAGYLGVIQLLTTTTATPIPQNSSGTYTTDGSISSTIPMTWTTNDGLYGTFIYEAA